MGDIDRIQLERLSKRYTAHWIVKNLTHEFTAGTIHGVMGANGSGKSTLLKMISGFLSPTAGSITYSTGGRTIDRDEIYRHVSFWAPYLSLVGDLTVREMINYVGKFKGLRTSTLTAFLDRIEWPISANAQIKSLSSGQNQRLGLGLVVLSTSSILLLDEPSSFLDETSKTWMHDLIDENTTGRILIIASNDPSDLISTTAQIRMGNAASGV
ncbi:MAG: ATP-binding cassette domain-containing protein [Bacteroidota bacterium]